MKFRNLIIMIVLLPNFAYASICTDFIATANGKFKDPGHKNYLDVRRSNDQLEGTFMHMMEGQHAAYTSMSISCQENQISFSWVQDTGPHNYPFKGSFSGTLNYYVGDRPHKRVYEIDNIHLTVNNNNSYMYAMIYYQN